MAMTAQDARNLSLRNSDRMKKIYNSIEISAASGFRTSHFTLGEVEKEEMEVLKAQGFSVSYELGDIDRKQYILVKW
jgi:hypothetical protein